MEQKSHIEPQNFGSDLQKIRDNLVANDGSGKVWQEGWYIFQDGKIQGPMGLMEALSRPYFGQDQQAALISRRGYNQWYDLKLLAPLLDPVAVQKQAGEHKKSIHHHLTDQDRTRSSPENFTKFNVGGTDIFESRDSPVSTFSKNLNESKEYQNGESQLLGGAPKKIFKTTKHPSLAPSLVKPVVFKSTLVDSALHSLGDGDPVSHTAADIAYKGFKPALEPSIKAPWTIRSKRLNKEREDPKKRPVKWVLPQGEPSSGEVIQEYFISRQKLRLGNLRSLALYGWIGFFASCGLIWGLWIAQTVRDIEVHSFGKPKTPWHVYILSYVPLIHFFYIYFLSKQIIAMESQNRYRTISTPLALIFGFFPPICISYLQRAVNNHWLLHAKSALLKQG